MNCTCNRNHVDDDEHAPTCATVLSAELAQLRAQITELRSIKITIDTPNEVCDGTVHDTIENIVKQYGQEALGWVSDDGHKTVEQLRADNRVLAKEIREWRSRPLYRASNIVDAVATTDASAALERARGTKT